MEEHVEAETTLVSTHSIPDHNYGSHICGTDLPYMRTNGDRILAGKKDDRIAISIKDDRNAVGMNDDRVAL